MHFGLDQEEAPNSLIQALKMNDFNSMVFIRKKVARSFTTHAECKNPEKTKPKTSQAVKYKKEENEFQSKLD